MILLLYIAGVVAVLSTIMMISRTNAGHALLYLIVSLLAVALVFALLGAPFAAVLEIIIYAGAIMVLFVFVIMMLNRGKAAVAEEESWLRPGAWTGPVLLSLILLIELALLTAGIVPGPAAGTAAGPPAAIGPKEVGLSLLGPYLIGVELASLLLLAALLGAYHLGRQGKEEKGEGGDRR